MSEDFDKFGFDHVPVYGSESLTFVKAGSQSGTGRNCEAARHLVEIPSYVRILQETKHRDGRISLFAASLISGFPAMALEQSVGRHQLRAIENFDVSGIRLGDFPVFI